MTVPKPPTVFRSVTELRCWGLKEVVVVVASMTVFLIPSILEAARIPASGAGMSAFSPPIRRVYPSNGVRPLSSSPLRKRNAVLEQAAVFRNSSRARASANSAGTVTQFKLLPQNIRQDSSSNNSSFMYNSSDSSSSVNTSDSRSSFNITPVAAAHRIGQALLDSNFYIIDNTIQCRSEDCFEAGMHNTLTDSDYNAPSSSVPPSASHPLIPSMKQQIADAILYTDFRKGRAREAVMHPRNIESIDKRSFENAEHWRNSALDALHKKLLQRPIEAVAKNIIFFLGDGMSVPTVTAARILKGQQVDHKRFGEEGELHMDTFPFTGVSKTFCSDAQVADSACTATAYFCGVKANSGTIGLTPAAVKNNCSAQHDPLNRLSSILAWAQASGKATGVVTTARVTHASPAGAYANIANRNWENNHEIKKDGYNPDDCDDIAEQLILRDPGRNINVILGGGRLQFLPRTKADPENGRRGFRTDGKDLIETWKEEKYQTRHAYVDGRKQLLQLDTSNLDYLLGLFAPSHLEYYHEQEQHDDPTLSEMTSVAVEILSKNPNGFFLFVEGARIDHAHHNNQGLRAIWETVEMDRAIKKADEMTHDEDTLILITADHSHTFSIAGYPPRGNPISGIAEIAMDDLPYTTLTYANGPAFKTYVNNRRYNISSDPVDDLKYKQIPNIPRKSETHGGDDVLVMAKGPFAHLFTGVQEQSYIPHALGYAACIGSGPKFCDVLRDHVFY